MKNRVDRLKDLMIGQGIPSLFVSKLENQHYLSGFRSGDCHMVITEKEQYLLTDFRAFESAKEHAPQFEIVETNLDYTVHTFLKELGIKQLGVEEKVISVSDYHSLQENTGLELISGDDLVEEIRAIKDETELNSIKKAQALTDACFSHLITWIRPGLTELEVALEIELSLKKMGAERLSFDTICVSGNRTALPHGEPSSKIMEYGDFVTLDFGCVVDGYCSDMTRTIALGKVTKEQQDVYHVVLAAQTAACEAIASGMLCSDADGVARNLITEAGYGKAFGHGTGHGVGLEIHEAPRLGARSTDVLKSNMVVTVEPGIYLTQSFGVRIEDLAIVTDFTIINMTKSNKELIVI